MVDLEEKVLDTEGSVKSKRLVGKEDEEIDEKLTED